MKKVLFVATVTSHINGFHIPYLKMFKEKGYEVHVASFGEEPIEYCDKHFNIPFARFPFKLQNYKAYKKLKKIINDNEYEIIHCHTPVGGVLARLAAKKARKRGTRVIYTAHGFHFFKGAPILNWMIYYPIEKYLSKYTDCLITINKEDYEIAKKRFKAKRTEFVHGVGVDESKFNFEMSDDEKEDLRKSLNLKPDDFVLIQVGELNKNKNQIMSIKAMKDLVKENSNIHLLLAGKGKLEPFYRKKILEYNLQDNIHVLGYRNDVSKLFKISNCCISTSIREGLGLNVVEAMLIGIPILVTNNRGHRELIDDTENGFFINNENEIKEKIKYIMDNKSLINILEKKEKEKSSIFLLENILENMQKIYFEGSKR